MAMEFSGKGILGGREFRWPELCPDRDLFFGRTVGVQTSWRLAYSVIHKRLTASLPTYPSLPLSTFRHIVISIGLKATFTLMSDVIVLGVPCILHLIGFERQPGNPSCSANSKTPPFGGTTPSLPRHWH